MDLIWTAVGSILGPQSETWGSQEDINKSKAQQSRKSARVLPSLCKPRGWVSPVMGIETLHIVPQGHGGGYQLLATIVSLPGTNKTD